MTGLLVTYVGGGAYVLALWLSSRSPRPVRQRGRHVRREPAHRAVRP